MARRPTSRCTRYFVPGLGIALVLGVLCGTVGLVGCRGARDDGPSTWPDRPLTMIVPFDAGGGTDANARIVASLLERELGQPVRVVNRTGGSGVVGHMAIAHAAPDGYTVGYVTVEVAMMHWIGLTDLTYRDFTPLAMLSGVAGSVIVGADAPYASAADLMAAIEMRPATLKASGSGLGGIWHLTMAGMLEAMGSDPTAVTWVPHQGAAPALADLAAGGIDVVVCALAEARSLLDAGRVRALAVMGDRRHPLYAEVPTLREAVGRDYAVVAWGGVAGPPGLPTTVVDRLVEALRVVHASSELQELFAARGTGARFEDPQAFGESMAASDESLGELMTAIGMAQ